MFLPRPSHSSICRDPRLLCDYWENTGLAMTHAASLCRALTCCTMMLALVMCARKSSLNAPGQPSIDGSLATHHLERCASPKLHRACSISVALPARVCLLAYHTHTRPPIQDLIQIKARFGRSVASYFSFFRWIILNYIFVALMAMFFLVRHLAAGTFSWTETVNVYLPKYVASHHS